VFVFIALSADALFIYFLNMTQSASLGLAIGLGCLYLLARQWFWGVFTGNNNRAMERALPHLVETLIAQQKINPEKQWQQLVNRVFDPLKLERLNQPSDAVTIERGGVALHLPTLDGKDTIEAFCCEQGKRLYSTTDVNLAERLIELMRQSRDIVSVREQAALDERQRILRDLHDDVVARLLALLHQTREPAISLMAQNALRGLRDVVHMLGTEEMSLADTVIDIEANTREQLSGLGVALEWYSSEHWPEIIFTSQQHINLRRIARETIANALKHAQPQHLILHIEYIADDLHMRICNDGEISDPANWIPNRGLNNIKSRVAEMGASHKWVIVEKANKQRYCQLAVTMPLPLSEDLETHPAD
jgi:signal transduction histidine kinase